MTDQKLFFSIGPVQGFVAQARRTRDLWGGSFLLSFLTGHAMDSITRDGGKIVVPDVDNDELIQWIEGKRDGSDEPRIGSLPNIFQVDPDGRDPQQLANNASNALMEKWKEVAEAVWKKFVSPVSGHGNCTRDIWDRQIGNFWEIYWVVGKDASALAARKNWRTHYPPEEGGDHCTMMGDWQEISGFIRSREKKEQNTFWNELRKNVGTLDIQPDERLCAVALVKRLFPKVSEDAIGWDVKSTNWPSTLYIAALPWVKKVVEKQPELAREYAKKVRNAQPNAIRPGISDLFTEKCDNPFMELDGNFYLPQTLESQKLTPLKGTPTDGSEEGTEVKQTRKGLLDFLNNIRKEVDSSPSPYYALLLMDGDSIGKLLREQGDGGKAVSVALADFTVQVPKTLKNHNGVTVYAGGDDVLALLPVPKALACARMISGEFVDSFNRMNRIGQGKATISAGLVFAHFHVPLRSVMEEAHHLLDNVAKDGNGRASIAVSVLKPSGRYAQWVTTWDHFNSTGMENMKELVSMLGKSGGEKQLSTSFIYRTRDTFRVLAKDPVWNPGTYFEMISGLDAEKLLAAEYKRSMDDTEKGDPGEVAKKLLDISHRHSRNVEEMSQTDTGCICSDGMLLVKFLAENTMEGLK